ncbi:MAG TPA: VWA domain-containing protein [Blastocatellia bacterium]|nr:VWA domain-containing protein [Blastocatellia bacterium]
MRHCLLMISLVLLLSLNPTGAESSGAAANQDSPPATRPRRVLPAESKPSQNPVQNQPQNQDEAIRLTSRLVLVPVSASDAAGNPVRDLTAQDFALEEEGRAQPIMSLGEPGKVPTEIAILLDVSGSTRDQFAFEQQAAVRFITEVIKPSDAVSVFSIGTTPNLVKARTTNGEEAITGLMSIAPAKAATAFFDSVSEASLYLGKTGEPGSRRVLVVISDGEENYSVRTTLSSALRELQKNDCLFYSINPSGSSIGLNNKISVKGQNFMEAMSSQTGGKAFVPEKITDLQAVFRQIAAELQAQYLLGYYSTDERADGGFRRISVRAPRRPDLRVRARQGYYAPGPGA